MDKILKSLKVLIKATWIILQFLTQATFYLVPIAIFYAIAVRFTILLVGKEYSSEIYKILFASIGITGTLSSLAFRASSSTQDSEKKEKFYNCGERLFHALLLSTLALIMNYFIKNPSLPGSDNLELIVIRMTCLITLFYFLYALMYLVDGVFDLNMILFKGNGKPLLIRLLLRKKS